MTAEEDSIYGREGRRVNLTDCQELEEAIDEVIAFVCDHVWLVNLLFFLSSNIDACVHVYM